MNIVFAGTPDIATPILTALINSEHTIKMVLSQPDRPKGRGRKLIPSPVKALALEHDLSIYQPSSLRNNEAVQAIQETKPDLIVVIAYGLLIPESILSIPRYGCINLHVSLLPRWRGAAPVQRAILAGDTETGMTIMQMDKGLDTGDIVQQYPCAISNDDTTVSLQNKLSTIGAKHLLSCIDDIAAGTSSSTPQDNTLAPHADKINKSEAKIDWQQDAVMIDRHVRALNPWPIAYTVLDGQRLRLWKTSVIEQQTTSPAGTIINISKEGIDVICGENSLRIHDLQWAGGKQQPAYQACNANQSPLVINATLGEDE
jgi:methionyl-tRNA formyltransferase